MKYRVIMQTDKYDLNSYRVQKFCLANNEWVLIKAFTDKSDALYFYNALMDGSMSEEGDPILVQS